MTNLNRSQFKFRKYDTIGAEGAEEDGDYLSECFVDIGALEALKDTDSHRCIVVGRTGSGKTALVTRLEGSAEHVVRIEPDQLSLQFIANSTIIRHLEELGVELDLFYRLLWRHVLVVQLIQLKYHIRSEQDRDGFLQRMRDKLFGDKKKTAALEYLVQWGKRFWEDTELRVHEVTHTLEDDVRASLGTKLLLLDASMTGGTALTTEERQEIYHRAQDVVNKVQIAKLTDIIRVLADEVFDDPQKHYYIVIDGLDENWVPDPLRYKLIRSLIEAVRDLRPIRSAKTIVAIRQDLLDRVFRYTRDSGFQEEKYLPYLLPLHWTHSQLLEVLDRRLNRLVRHHYSGRAVSWTDLFPAEIDKEHTDRYLVARTHQRPRDLIHFVNRCIALATDRPSFTAAIVRDAEAEYSRYRLRALAEEWAGDYPNLTELLGPLKGRPESFPADSVTEDQLLEVAFRISDFKPSPYDRLHPLAADYIESRIPPDEFRRRLIQIYYDLGIVGIRTESGRPTSWSYTPHDRVSMAEIGPGTKLVLCPMFHRALGMSPFHGQR
jgi:hypothetical protein